MRWLVGGLLAVVLIAGLIFAVTNLGSLFTPSQPQAKSTPPAGTSAPQGSASATQAAPSALPAVPPAIESVTRQGNFDFAATTLTAGNDEAFTFKLMVDRDPTAAVNLVEYTPGDNPARFFQNSVNSGFIDTDLATAGAQYYGFADGQFDVMLQAFDGTTLVAQNKVVVHVGDLDDTGDGSFYILLADGLPK